MMNRIHEYRIPIKRSHHHAALDAKIGLVHAVPIERLALTGKVRDGHGLAPGMFRQEYIYYAIEATLAAWTGSDSIGRASKPVIILL